MSSSKASARPRVLVTGATGFVGTNLCGALADTGYEVHVLRRSRPEPDEQMDVISHIGDVTKPDSLSEALTQSNEWAAVVHAAGVVAYSSKMGDLMEQVNVNGTRNMLDAVEKLKPRPRFIHVSSVVAIGANSKPDDPPLDETTQWDKAGEKIGYLRTKKCAEDLVMEAVSKRGLDAVVVCPSNIYGPGDAKKGSRSNQLKAANGKLAFYTNGGVNVIGVRQCCAAIVNAIKQGKKGERYILGGENITIKEMLTEFSTAAGAKPPSIGLPNWVLFLACALGEAFGSNSLTMERAAVATLFHWYDSSKARRELNLQPTRAKEAITNSVQWMKEYGYLSDVKKDG